MHKAAVGIILKLVLAFQLGVVLGPVQPRAVGTLHGVNLAWTASATPSVTYRIYRGTVHTGPYTLIASGISGTAYSDTGLPSATTYYYVLTSFGPTGESAQTPEVSATTL